jgi:hypothetical protein
VKGKLVGRINVLLQNRNDKIIFVKKGTEIGGYMPQCSAGKDRYKLASVEGMRLAAALGMEGAGTIEGLQVTSSARQGKGSRQAAGTNSTQTRSPRRGLEVAGVPTHRAETNARPGAAQGGYAKASASGDSAG